MKSKAQKNVLIEWWLQKIIQLTSDTGDEEEIEDSCVDAPCLHESRYGFRCLCAGYEDAPFTTNRQGLLSLEMELVYAGAACATKLIMPSIDIPQLSY
ncbi:unnamed protein product, partial [Leptidea sinapis]